VFAVVQCVDQGGVMSSRCSALGTFSLHWELWGLPRLNMDLFQTHVIISVLWEDKFS